MRRITSAADLAVKCPMCYAKPGENCINLGHGARFTGVVHRERKAAANVWHQESLEVNGG